jgi:type I restriction-modification system DNA methylase subunit
MTILTNEDKISIINQHKKNVEYSKYNLQVSLIEENAVTSPDQDAIDALNNKISEIDKKITALDAEISSLS